MRDGRTNWTVTALLAVVAVLATLLTADLLREGGGTAMAQVSEGASANYTIALLGEETNDHRPLFLIDTRAQSIMVYEYFESQRILLLRGARSYANDRALTEANFFRANDVYSGPSVRDIQTFLTRGALPTPPTR